MTIRIIIIIIIDLQHKGILYNIFVRLIVNIKHLIITLSHNFVFDTIIVLSNQEDPTITKVIFCI